MADLMKRFALIALASTLCMILSGPLYSQGGRKPFEHAGVDRGTVIAASETRKQVIFWNDVDTFTAAAKFEQNSGGYTASGSCKWQKKAMQFILTVQVDPTGGRSFRYTMALSDGKRGSAFEGIAETGQAR